MAFFSGAPGDGTRFPLLPNRHFNLPPHCAINKRPIQMPNTRGPMRPPMDPLITSYENLLPILQKIYFFTKNYSPVPSGLVGRGCGSADWREKKIALIVFWESDLSQGAGHRAHANRSAYGKRIMATKPRWMTEHATVSCFEAGAD